MTAASSALPVESGFSESDEVPLIRPFAGLRPAPQHAAEVAAPPYDVLSTVEARARAADRPWSFLHISKPEIDLPHGTDPYAAVVYAKAAESLQRMLGKGVLLRDEKPCFYVWRMVMGDLEQTGLVAAASVAEYDRNRIRRHEFTRPDKEDDRVRQIEALNAQTGPVLLAYPEAPAIDAMLAQAAEGEPVTAITADTGVQHTLWRIDDREMQARLTADFDALQALYIADGHHRSAAASRVAAARRAANARHTGDESYNYFLAVAFPHHQMHILPYNRLVLDLNGMDRARLLQRLQERFWVEESIAPIAPAQPATFGLYIEGDWYKLAVRPEFVPADDPVARLDVSLLADNVLAPVFGIDDPRRDKRIDFVGGIRGLEELEARVGSGEAACAFSLFATRMQDLMAVADAGKVMPPKSTWFEPKLADGLVSHVLD
jgi:uncharacterized protein (DUF1015 family)